MAKKKKIKVPNTLYALSINGKPLYVYYSKEEAENAITQIDAKTRKEIVLTKYVSV